VVAISVRRTPSHSVTVTAVSELTPRLRRITLAGPTLQGLVTAPAQDVELIIAGEPGPTGSVGPRVKRRYTIRTARPDAGELDIDALSHPHGPGGRWVAAAQTGNQLEFLGPRGHLELRPAPWHLFIGDEASLPAIAALVEALAPTETATVLAEVGDSSDEIALLPAASTKPDSSVTWLHRGDVGPGGFALVGAALSRLKDENRLPVGDGRAYLLGESRAMVALRPQLEALGIPADRSYVKGYWNLGRGERRIPTG
jgi:NADPH-dependent ferric siderophore reductase